MSIEAKIKEAEEKLAKADADKASREAWLGGWCGTLVLLGRFGGLAKLVCFSPKKTLIQAAMEELRRGEVAGAGLALLKHSAVG